jgi:hypothetical protein
MTDPLPPPERGPSADNPLHLVVTLKPEPEAIEAGRLAVANRFIKTPLGAALLALVFTTVIGGGAGSLISNHFAEKQREATDYSQRVTASETLRRDLIDSFAKGFSGRRTAAGLVKSAIVTDASDKELSDRWAGYQQTYIAYNTSDFPFKADLLEFLGANTTVLYTRVLDHSISRSLARIDRCLTDAYRLRRAGKRSDAKAHLSACTTMPGAPAWAIDTELDKLQGCFATFETELMYSIYLENHFDLMREAARNVGKVQLVSTDKGADGEPVRGQTNKLSSINAKTHKAWACKSPTDWACQRVLGRGATAEKLASDNCGQLANSYDAPPLALGGRAGPKAVAGR